MDPKPLYYPPRVETYIRQCLHDKPGLNEFFKRLEDSVKANPEQASPEIIVLDNGMKIQCRRKSVRATSYSQNMVFSKDEIVILYEITEMNIRVISVFFP